MKLAAALKALLVVAGIAAFSVAGTWLAVTVSPFAFLAVIAVILFCIFTWAFSR